MDIGRNDPCHCGSGKKYKKCCLAKDEEAKRKEAKEAGPPPVSTQGSTTEPEAPSRKERPKPPSAPRIEAWNARYDEFESSDYEERVALFNQTLDEVELPSLMDEEMAFEMLNELFEQAVERDERDRYDSLVESLRERLPKVYEKEAGSLLENRITNALVMRRPELAHTLTLEFAALAHKEIDLWNQIESRLAYHGYLTTLVEAMRLVWPKVRRSRNIVGWGIDEFRARASEYEIINYIEQTDAPDANDSVLLERLRVFNDDDIEADRLSDSLAYLTGRKASHWSPGDFNLETGRPGKKRRGESVNEGEQNLFFLTTQFVWYAHNREGVSYTRAEMASGEIYKFILLRHSGELEDEEGDFGSASGSRGRRRGAAMQQVLSGNQLCPDRESLARHIGRLLDFTSHQPSKAAALMELIPAWMRFLQTQGLVDAELRKRTLDSLKPLAGDLLRAFDNLHSDPTLREAIKRWPEDAGKEPQ